MKKTLLAALLGASALSLAAAPCFAYEAKDVSNGGKIEGTAKLTGAAPKLAPVKHAKDEKVCGKTGPDDSLVVHNGDVENVVVTVEATSGKKIELPAAKLDQKGCDYIPHVQAVPVGTSLEIINSDPVLHNIHAYLGDQTTFNNAMPIKNQRLKKALGKPGLLKVKCDVHSWMHAYVVVTDNPYYAVTGKDGKFEISGLAPGEYTVTAWHERLGTQTSKVSVAAGKATTASFKFAAK